MRPEIRPARTADVDAVLTLWRDADTVPTATDDADALLGLLAHDPGALLVAEADGAIVGSLIAAWNGWRGSFYRLAVAPSHRRRGLGRALLAAGEARLTGVGARRLDAIVAAHEPLAVAFWDVSPFERQHERFRYVRTR